MVKQSLLLLVVSWHWSRFCFYSCLSGWGDIMVTFLLFLCFLGTGIGLLAVLYGTVHNKKEAIIAGMVMALSTIAFLIVLAQSGWLS